MRLFCAKRVKKSSEDFPFSADPPLFRLQSLTVRALRPDEFERAGRFFDDEHYLGDLAAGRGLLQVVEDAGRWVALLDWGQASWKLADRDAHIGWTQRQRADRLALVVQNRRFLVLADARMPNLASRSLALATRALPEHWEAAHGHRPLMAETFTDIERFEGTAYKAAGWLPCGMSKGFQRADFDRHGRLKKLWLKSLNRNSGRILTAIDLPKKYRLALNEQSPERDLPLKKGELMSLRDYLRDNFKDTRRANRTYPASSLLAFMAMALMAGRNDLAAIQRYGRFLTQRQRRWLDFPCKRGTSIRKCPSYKALWSFVHGIDAEAFAACLNAWLGAHTGTLPRALALDGKWVRDRALSLCLSEHETGAPVAVGFARPGDAGEDTDASADTEKATSGKAKREGEQTVAKRLYKQTDLNGAVVTADALFCDQHQARAVIEAGGDFVFQIKNENRQAYKAAEQTAVSGSPFLPTAKNPTQATDESIKEG